MFHLSPVLLSQVAPNIKGNLAVDISGKLVSICPMYGIDTADIFHEFIANVLHESAQFSQLTEGLNYSAQGLANTFPGRYAIDPHAKFKVPNQLAKSLHKQPVAIANNVYANRLGNGDEKSGDGWQFRGSGPIQLTGKENITVFANYYNQKFGKDITPGTMALYLRSNIEIGIHSACWIFAVAKKLIPLAISDNMKEIVHKINGGYIGLTSRLKYYNYAKRFISETNETTTG